jgi:1-deoxyxylulose-5-phosphate synthase
LRIDGYVIISSMKNIPMTRREFIKETTISAGVAWAASHIPGFSAEAQVRKVSDQVALGKTGIKLSRLGFGCGTNSGEMQRGLGHKNFNDLVRYAYDQGITYFDTADAYGTHTWVGEAIKGMPREKLYIQSKIMAYPGMGGFGGGMGMRGNSESALNLLDRFRKELGVDYIDTVLLHCQIAPDWDEQMKPLREGLEEAKQKKIIRAHGVSCHSLQATTKAASLNWVDVNLVRVNPQGVNIDTPALSVFGNSDESHFPAVVEQLKIMKKNGHGVIGMKMIGEGAFTNIEDRKKAFTWAMQSNLVDAVVAGMKNRKEIDEAIHHINAALN